MSPLAHSLLVLAALVAAACAYCTTVQRGVIYGYPLVFDPVDVPSEGAVIDFPNLCGYNGNLYGEVITVCNKNPYGNAPDVKVKPDKPYSPVNVTCPDDSCPYGMTMNVTQYCAITRSSRH